MLPVDTETYEQLAEDFGLEMLCLQNDIEPWELVRLMHMNGWLDLDDYFFGEVDDVDD